LCRSLWRFHSECRAKPSPALVLVCIWPSVSSSGLLRPQPRPEWRKRRRASGEIDVGTALRTKRAGCKDGGFSTDGNRALLKSPGCLRERFFRFGINHGFGRCREGGGHTLFNQEHRPESLRRKAETWSRKAADRRPRNKILQVFGESAGKTLERIASGLAAPLARSEIGLDLICQSRLRRNLVRQAYGARGPLA